LFAFLIYVWLNSFCMNISNTTLSSSVETLLRSLNFIDITGIHIMDGSKTKKIVGFSGQRFRCLWKHKGHYTAIVNSEGDVFLRYGDDDVTKGSVFNNIVTELGCSEDTENMIISSCTPTHGQQFDTEQLMERIFG